MGSWKLSEDGTLEFTRDLPNADGWQVTSRLELSEHGMDLTRVEIHPGPNGASGGITRATIRAVSTRDIRREALTLLRKGSEPVRMSPALRGRLSALRTDAEPSLTKPGRRKSPKHKLSDLDKAERAASYIACLEHPAPVPEWAKRNNVAVKSAPRLIAQLRPEYLTKAPGRGVAGGSLTEKALELLASQEEPE